MMKLIRADHERRYEILGELRPARRPVDVDASSTGFTRLRSLRIYRFEAGSVVNGHAEEDEVFVVVTSGAVEIAISSEEHAAEAPRVRTLAAPDETRTEPFVAYLPPRAVYRLTPHTVTDVAYVRATPQGIREPAVFHATQSGGESRVHTLLQEHSHAERLRLTVTRVKAQGKAVTLDLLGNAGANCEALFHAQGSPAGNIGSLSTADGVPLAVGSWDTVAISPGERPVLRVAEGIAAFTLTAFAV